MRRNYINLNRQQNVRHYKWKRIFIIIKPITRMFLYNRILVFEKRQMKHG